MRYCSTDLLPWRLGVVLTLVACMVAALAGRNAWAQEKTDPAAAGMDPVLLARIPVKMRTYVDGGKAAGFVTMVARHGHVASLEAVGYQNLETKTPMRTDTIFRIASMTKSFTVAGVMILVDQGRLSLLDPVEGILPEFKGLKVSQCRESTANQGCDLVDTSRRITILDLMTHTSGLPAQGAQGSEAFNSLAERVRVGAHVALIAQPGTRWIYSQIGYAALGRIIEVCSGTSYEQFLANHLFQPLGMDDTYFFLPPEKQSRLAVLYSLDQSGSLIVSPRSTEIAKIAAPEGGALTTAADMGRFYQMLMNKGTLNGKRILSMTAVEAMITNHTGDLEHVEASPGLGMGLSFGVVKDAIGTYRYQAIGTFCKGGAFRTYGWGDPTRDMFGIILFQRTNGGGDTAPEINEFSILANAAITH